VKPWPTVIIAGGGTGGHLYPGLAIAAEVKRRCGEAEIVFVGTAGKIEARVVPNAGYAFETIWISGLRRTLSWSLLVFPVKVVVSLLQTAMIFRRRKPTVVVGTGGYVCGPPVYVASLLRIPTVLQEQNSIPGATTRLLAKRADEVYVTFEQSRNYLPAGVNVIVSGNPVRSVVGSVAREDGARFFGLETGRPTVLAFGGSLGASSINTAIEDLLPMLGAGGIQLIWQTGEHDLATAQRAVNTLPAAQKTGMRVQAFIERMDMAFGASDLAVCRAGATTLAELALAGLPAILVPYPHAAADHQTENARTVAASGAALLCPDHEVRSGLSSLLFDLLKNGDRRRQMAEQMRSLAHPEAAATIAAAVIRLSKHGHG
jgi:UDP-N-acetylglucosamine--N-acetylmuramyl-(pentapeptide) pyrophosphoryl-undecaprenol N-acetylglucosamine transferase